MFVYASNKRNYIKYNVNTAALCPIESAGASNRAHSAHRERAQLGTNPKVPTLQNNDRAEAVASTTTDRTSASTASRSIIAHARVSYVRRQNDYPL